MSFSHVVGRCSTSFTNKFEHNKNFDSFSDILDLKLLKLVTE